MILSAPVYQEPSENAVLLDIVENTAVAFRALDRKPVPFEAFTTGALENNRTVNSDNN